MSGNLYQAFGVEIAAQRRAQFELQARHNSQVRALKRARKVDRERRRAERQRKAERAARRPGQACCAADLG